MSELANENIYSLIHSFAYSLIKIGAAKIRFFEGFYYNLAIMEFA